MLKDPAKTQPPIQSDPVLDRIHEDIIRNGEARKFKEEARKGRVRSDVVSQRIVTRQVSIEDCQAYKLCLETIDYSVCHWKRNWT